MAIIKFFDTSALLGGYDLTACPPGETFYISTIVFKELEHIKTSHEKDEVIKYKARRLIRSLMDQSYGSWMSIIPLRSYIEEFIEFNPYIPDNNDGLLIAEASYLVSLGHTVEFITADAAQYLIANNVPEIKTIYYNETFHKENLWKGYQDIELTEVELANLYENPDKNILNLDTNEYAVITNNGNVVDLIKWNGKCNGIIKYSNQLSDFFGTVKPLNDQQKLFFDLLQNRQVPIKLARGQYGSGKTFLALVHAMNYVKQRQFDKVVYVRNNVEVAGSQRLGALPGEQEDKLMPWLMPLADILGDEEALRQAIETGEIEPVHLGYIRGRSFTHSIIFVDEAENLTTDNVKLIVGRAGEGSEVWFLGDESQTDSDIFRKNSGIASLLNSLKGDPHFGAVELQKSERSAVAQLAAKIKGES